MMPIRAPAYPYTTRWASTDCWDGWKWVAPAWRLPQWAALFAIANSMRAGCQQECAQSSAVRSLSDTGRLPRHRQRNQRKLRRAMQRRYRIRLRDGLRVAHGQQNNPRTGGDAVGKASPPPPSDMFGSERITPACRPRPTSIPSSPKPASSIPPLNSQRHAHIRSMAEYERLYREAEQDPAQFWAGIASELHWFKPWDQVLEWNCPWAKWFSGGQINLSYNCLDRHVATWRRNKAALIWEGEPGEVQTLTYQQLLSEVSQVRERAEIVGRRKRRPRGDLHGHVPRAYPSPCWPARASAHRIPSSSAAFRRTRWWTASTTRRHRWSSRRMAPTGAAPK